MRLLASWLGVDVCTVHNLLVFWKGVRETEEIYSFSEQRVTTALAAKPAPFSLLVTWAVIVVNRLV